MTHRPYTPADFHAVRDFLVASVPHFDPPANWFLDRWNFVSEVGRCFHGLSREDWARGIGLWCSPDGAIQAMANEEEGTGSVFFQFARPELATPALIDEMCTFAEASLAVDGAFALRATLPAVEAAARARAYRQADWSEPISRLDLAGLRKSPLPDAYRLVSAHEVSTSMRALAHARAFGYADSLLFGPRAMKAFGNVGAMTDWNPVLDAAIVGPLGDVVSFATAWLDTRNSLAVLEPVGTVPEHRRRGLAHAAIAHCLLRAKDFGARTAWVGSDQEVYQSFGFNTVVRYPVWEWRLAR